MQLLRSTCNIYKSIESHWLMLHPMNRTTLRMSTATHPQLPHLLVLLIAWRGPIIFILIVCANIIDALLVIVLGRC